MPQAITKEKEIERRLKISSALKGIKKLPFSDKTKTKMSLSAKGNKSHLRFKHSEETRKKICEAREKQGSNVWNKGKSYLAIKGEKHWNWQGGKTPINIQIRNSIEYKLWRDSVFQRDNWTCVWCKARGKKKKRIILNADHIKSFADYPELRFAIDNGRTLCLDCHKKTNSYLNRWTGNNNKT